MADKFSLEDIVAEYSNKSAKGRDVAEDIDAQVDEIIEETNSKDLDLKLDEVKQQAPIERESIFTARETEDLVDEKLEENTDSADFSFEKTAVAASAIIKDDSNEEDIKFAESDLDLSSSTYNFEDEVEADDGQLDEVEIEREQATDKNVKILENLLKHKKDTVIKTSENAPINRPSVKDMDMRLSGKVIPKTEELEKIVPDIPSNATYEEKSRLLSERRQNKINNFTLDTKEDEKFKEKNANKKSTAQKEFESVDEAPKILKDILQIKSHLTTRMFVLLFVGVFSLVITIANDVGFNLVKVFDKTMSPSAFLFTNTILGLIACAFSYTVLSEGLKNLFKGKADCDSIAAIGLLFSLISGIVTLFDPLIVRESFYHVYTSVAIFGLIFNTLGKLMIVKRTEENFKFVSGDYESYALVNIENEDVASKLTKGTLNDFPELATMKKTDFIDDFMSNSYSSDISDQYAKKATPFIILVSLVVGVLSIFFERSTSGATEKIFTLLAAVSGTISMCSSLALMLIVNVPMGRGQKKYLKYSGVMLGYSSVEDFSDTNSVLIDAEQLFPNGMVDLVNLKLLSSTRIEECILMAASLACQAGSVLRPTFYKILKGKTEMLYPVESYVYEDGLGLSGWIENKRILLGTRELMENHSIDGLPSLAKEEKYAKDNIVVYLSVSGVVSSLFVVRVNASLSVTRWLQELEQEEIVTAIRTVDGFIDSKFISELFGIEQESIKILPFRFYKDYEKETEYTPKVSASMFCSGHFPSFAMLLIGAKRLKFVSNLGVAVQLGAAVLGGVLSILMMVLGAFAQITPTIAICYNLAFVFVTLIIQHLKKV